MIQTVQSKRRKPRLSLVVTLCVLLFLMVFLFNTVSSSVITGAAHNILLDNTRENLHAAISDTVARLDASLAQYGALISSLAGNNYIRSYLRFYAGMTPVVRARIEQKLYTKLKALKEHSPGILDVLIVSEDVFYNDKSRGNLILDYDYTGQAWYGRILGIDRGAPLLMSQTIDFYRNSFMVGMEVLTVGMPVLGYDNTPIGVVLFFLDKEAFSQTTLLSKGDGENQYYLVNGDDSVLVSFSDTVSGGGVDTIVGMPAPSAQLSLAALDALDPEALLRMPSIWVVERFPSSEYGIVGHISLRRAHEQIARLRRLNLLMVLLFGVLGMLLSVGLYVLFRKGVNHFLQHLARLESSDAEPRKPLRFVEAQDMARRFKSLVDGLRDMTEKNLSYQLSYNQIRFETLLSQINPHFFFNTLQFLQSEIVYGDKQKANELLLSLGNLFRFTTSRRTDAYVPVREEIDFTRTYLHICQQCYSDGLRIVYEIDPEIEDLIMPRFLLQPIAENAIKHGFHEAPYENTLRITGKLEGDAVRFIVEDDGRGMAPEALSRLRATLNGEQPTAGRERGIGLTNIHQRIRLLFGDGYGVAVDSAPDAFFKVTLRVAVVRTMAETARFLPDGAGQ